VPALVIGYNVVTGGDVTSHFLQTVREVHERRSAPCTLYVASGMTDEHCDALTQLASHPLFDLQVVLNRPLKTVCQLADGETTVWTGMSLDEADEEIGAALATMRDRIGVRCTGLSDAIGCYRGLQDRPDILDVLARHGIGFCRTYARNETDWQPVRFSVEPFWYTSQGHPDIAEFPSQGWQNATIRGVYGWDDVAGYSEYVVADVDEAARREDQVWSYWISDGSAIREDVAMSIVERMLECADEAGLEALSQLEAYGRLPHAEADEVAEPGNSPASE